MKILKVNSLNQYTSATESNVQLDFAYDLDGSMTYRPADATSGWTQVWNGENRMVETYKGNDRLTFTYDYMGRRVEKCVYSGNALLSKTCYVYDGFKCVEELDALSNNAVTLRHFWQPFDVGLDVILASADISGSFYFLHNANKNVMQKTNSNGALSVPYVAHAKGCSYVIVQDERATKRLNRGNPGLSAAKPRGKMASTDSEAPTRLNYSHHDGFHCPAGVLKSYCKSTILSNFLREKKMEEDGGRETGDGGRETKDEEHGCRGAASTRRVQFA